MYIPSNTVLNHNARPDQISPAIHSSTAQRCAVPCGVVPCLALRCGVVLRCALFRTYSSATGIRVVYSSFVFSTFDLSWSPCLFPRANYTRTADQNVTPPTSTQHSTGQFALHKQLLALSNRCSYQIMGIFLSAPYTCSSCILPCASVAGGVSRPRSGALVQKYIITSYGLLAPLVVQ